MSSKAELILNRATAKVTRNDHHTFYKNNYYKTTKISFNNIYIV